MGEFDMRISRDTGQHVRLKEFTDFKFYSTDFMSVDLKFITTYSIDGEVLGEYAHIPKSPYQNFWVKPNSEIITSGKLIEELVEECKKHNSDGILMDLYIDDSFKPNPTLKRHVIFGYRMTMSNATRKSWCRGKKGWMEQLYNLEPVDDIHSFHSLSQIIPEI